MKETSLNVLMEKNVFNILPLMCNSQKCEDFPKRKEEGKGKNTIAMAHLNSLCFSLFLQLKLSSAGNIKIINLKIKQN